ncbi:MAG: hypothetical protein ACOX3K_02020 [Bacilli bacterium]
MRNLLKHQKNNIIAIAITEAISLLILSIYLILRHYFKTGIGNTFRMIFAVLTLGISFGSYLVFFLYKGLRKSQKEKMTIFEWKKYYRATFIVIAIFLLLSIGVYILAWNFPPYNYPLIKAACIVYGVIIIIGLLLSPLIYFTIMELLELKKDINETIVTRKEEPLWPEESAKKELE